MAGMLDVTHIYSGAIGCLAELLRHEARRAANTTLVTAALPDAWQSRLTLPLTTCLVWPSQHQDPAKVQLSLQKLDAEVQLFSVFCSRHSQPRRYYFVRHHKVQPSSQSAVGNCAYLRTLLSLHYVITHPGLTMSLAKRQGLPISSNCFAVCSEYIEAMFRINH